MQASIDREDSVGRRCLHVACQTGRLESLTFLVDQCKADPGAVCTGNGASGLHIAAKVLIQSF